MSAESDKLREMIDEVDKEIENIESQIDSIGEQITEQQEKQDALEFAMDNCCYDTTSGLITVLLPPKGEGLITHSNFSISNAKDWIVGDIELDNNDSGKDNIIYLSSTQFECDNDHTTAFSVGQTVGFDLGGGSGVEADVDSSDYNITTPGKTTVIMDNTVLTSAVENAIIPTYVYEGVGWDDDQDIQDRIDEFDFIYNYKTQLLGLDGTYGTEDKIAKLTDAKDMLVINKTQALDSKTKLEKFAS